MSLLADWLNEHATIKSAPLFWEDSGIVRTNYRGRMKKLVRHPDFDTLMINIIEEGLLSDSWEGLVYVMHWRRGDKIYPLYVGKAERRGVRHELSFNIRNIRKNTHAFGRWGYGLDYHVGDLSHAIFGEEAYRKPSSKYRRWTETLFSGYDPPTLRERVYVASISWYQGMRGPSRLVCSVPAAEKELIALAGAEFPDILLNVDGR